MNDIERQRQHFERVSDRYYTARRHQNHLELKKLLWDLFLDGKGFVLEQGGRVLEPMCGYSEGRKILNDRFGMEFQYSGFDYSRPLVEQAKASHPGDKIFVQDINQFEAEDKYDLIILIGGLHHVYARKDDVLKRMYRALQPGGYFINFEPTQDNFFFKMVREWIYRRNSLFDHETERAFDLQEINDAYRAAGFELVDQIYPGLLSYVLYYNPDAFPNLNLGNKRVVNFLFRLESPLFRRWIARKLSFATLSLLRRPD